MSTALQMPCPPALYNLLKARGARCVRLFDFGQTHIIYTEEPFGLGEFGIHISISADGRNPTWEEQRDVVWALCSDKTMASYIPPRENFGTLPGSHVFHWFEVLDQDPEYISQLGDWL